MKHTQIVAYDPSWPAASEQEAARLAGNFGEDLVAIHQMGSTAVPGLQAKPVIDILPVVREISCIHLLSTAMHAAGYELGVARDCRLAGLPKRGEEHPTHRVPVLQVGNPEIARHLGFLGCLRGACGPGPTGCGGRARQFLDEIALYSKRKDAFVMETQHQAMEHRERPCIRLVEPNQHPANLVR